MNQSVRTTVILVSLLAVIFFLVWGLGSARLPLLISFALAYLVFPLIQKVEKKGVSRQWAVLGAFVIYLIGCALTLALVIPVLWSDAQEMAAEFPTMASRGIEKLEGFLSEFGIAAPLSQSEIRLYIESHLSELASSVLKGFTSSFRDVFANSLRWILAVLNLFLIPLFFFYVINDFEKISRELKSFIPKSVRPRVSHYFRLCNRVLSGYIRGQLIVALILGVLYSVGLTVIGLRFGLLIGMVTGIVSIIPYVGFSLGFVTALLVALTHASGMGVIIGVVVVFLVVQALEGTVITPKFVGDQVGLSSLATILSLIIGGNVFGLTGIIVAIPAAAVLKAVIWDLKEEYQKLDIYQ